MPDPKSMGGPAACEPPFVGELRRQGESVEEETYVYGEKLLGTSSWERINRVLHAAFLLRQKLNRGSFDLLHLNSSFDSRALLRDVATLAIVGGRVKVFMKFHGGDAELLKTKNTFQAGLVRRLLTRVDGIGVLSTEEKRNFVNAGWPENKFFVVKNVVKQNFPDPAADFNSKHGLAEGVPTLLFIARFIPAKGLLDLIHALRLLLDNGTDCALFCVGDGPQRVAAEELVAKLNLTGRVKFVGLISENEAAVFYANCTLLVLPTWHFEGFPMSIFNAVSAGMPVITTQIRGAADYLSEPENCLWVGPRNPVMLAEKIAALLKDPVRRQAMSKANKELAKKFSAEVVTKEYLEAYRSVIG